MTRIVADTTCGLSPSVARQLDLPMISQIITFGDESFREGIDLDHAGFMAKLRERRHFPKTAAPYPGDFIATFNALIDGGETSIVCIHPSSELSGTMRSAQTARESFPSADIRIIDTRTVAGPLASMVLEADKLARSGASADMIEARVNAMMPRARIYFVVDTLEFLQRGGRMSGAQAAMGTLLQIKPILTIKDGKVGQFERERTLRRALNRLKELVQTEADRGGEAFVTVMHTAVPDQAETLAQELKQMLNIDELLIMDLVPAIVTHAGPGALAVGFFAADPPEAPEVVTMSLTIIETDTNSRRDVDRFVELPFRLYRDCQTWVPPLISDVKLMLNRTKYPYYQHSQAAFFIAERDSRVVSRIAVLDNRHYNEHWHSQTAFFYLFESEADSAAAQAVFGAAEQWARDRGLTKLVGAKGFLQGDGIGILVEGFEHHPAIGIPYNYPYYAALVEGAGFTRQRDFFSAYLPGSTVIPVRLFEIADRMRERRGFTIKRFKDKRELREMVPRIVQVYNDSFVNNWEYNPVTPAEATVIGERLLSIADPRFIKLVMKGEEIIGFLFGFCDVSDGLRRANGRLFPFGWFWILRDFRRTKWINLNGAGILAPFRGLGVNAVLYAEMEKTMKEGRFEHADLTQMEESVLTINDTLRLGAKMYKTHRIYEKAL